MDGCVCPARMETDEGEMVTLLVSELDRLTVVPPTGAADESVTGKEVEIPGDKFTPAGRMIAPLESPPVLVNAKLTGTMPPTVAETL